MAISKRSKLLLSPSSFSRLQSILLYVQRGNHTSSEENVGSSLSKVDPKNRGSFDPSVWKTYNSRVVGIDKSAISKPAWTALYILRQKGFEAYLVGGCVRDLLLNRVPKDFDVITTASLQQVKKRLYSCFIVGRRFPICHVTLFGTVIEVSSFNKGGQEKTEGKHGISHKGLKACNEIDILRWENSMQRDFTINGLFFDPSKNTVYDYVNGMKDLRASKVTTVIPAHLSFKEDCGRILRGLRIAARLGFELCEETAAAVREFSSLVRNLEMARLMLELNFMLAYGAARPSIQLLQKYRLLDIFLPFHAAYLDDQTKNGSDDSNTMLMKLFSNLDKLLAPDRPCDPTLWLGLLGFHVALVSHPQNAKVVQLYSALMYYGSWSKAMEFIKQTEVKKLVSFLPEIRESYLDEPPMSEKQLRKEINHFSLLIESSMDIFTSLDSISRSLARYPNAPQFSGKIVIFEKKRKNAAKLFYGLDHEIESYNKIRKSYNIDYELLKDGQRDETRFVLGKVIMDTINSGNVIMDSINSGKVIMDTINSTEAPHDGVALREKKVDCEIETGRIKHHPLSKNANKINKGRQSNLSLTSKDVKKRDNKTKKSYHPLHKNTVTKTINGILYENGTEMNDSSSQNRTNTNNSTTSRLSALFK